MMNTIRQWLTWKFEQTEGGQKMKNIIKFFMVMAVLCAVTACSQAFKDVSSNKKKQETTKGRLVMNVGSESRTIMPTITDNDIKNAKLTANGTEIKSWSSNGIIEQIENEDDILLDVGIYDFEMTFSNENGNVFLIGTIDDKEIKSGNNSLIFDMKLVQGNGNIAIELNWEADDGISKIKAGLYDIATCEAVAGYEAEEIVINEIQAEYAKNDVPAGQYIIKFEVYDATNKLLNTLTDVIKVISGITTTEQKILNKVNTQYTITYNLDGGSWKAGFTPVTVHNANNGITLPTNKNITKTGYKLSGWYTDETFSGEKIEIIPSGTAEDVTLYAKYEDCYVVATEDVPQTIAGLAAGGPYNILVTGTLTSDTISAIKTALGNNRYAKVNLDLSDTTGLTSIGYEAFRCCDSLTSMIIPDSVTSIEENAFYDCSRLTSVTIPDSVTSIGQEAFYDCDSLTSVTIGNGVASIGQEAFDSCDCLTNVTIIGNGETSISQSAFSYCRSLTSVTIGNGVKYIGEAFDGCTSLTNVTIIGNGVASIDRDAFSYCSSLTSVTIGNGVASIGWNAFDGCTSLTNVTIIGNGAASIGWEAFDGCTSLTSVTIGNGVISIDRSAFKCCSSLASVTIPDSVTSIGQEAFEYCSSLTSVTIGNGVTSIDRDAFRDCDSLTSVTIGKSTTSIGDSAFSGCSNLESVTIPDCVASIGQSAFEFCNNLTTVNYRGTQEQWKQISFGIFNNYLKGANINYNYTGE